MNNQYRPDFSCVIPGERRAGQNGQPEHNAPGNNLAEPRYNSGEQSRAGRASNGFLRASAFCFYDNRSTLHAPRASALQPARKTIIINSCNHVSSLARLPRMSILNHKTLTP